MWLKHQLEKVASSDSEDLAYAACWQELVRQCPLALFPVLQSSVDSLKQFGISTYYVKQSEIMQARFPTGLRCFQVIVATLHAINAISARKDRMFAAPV